MLRLIVTAITLSLALTVPAHAQTLEQVTKLSDFLIRTTVELGTAGTNLLQMSERIPTEEIIVIDGIYDSLEAAQCSFGSLFAGAEIYSLMADNRNQAKAKKFLGLWAKQAVRQANVTIKIFNQRLAIMRSPAAIAEVQKARDLVQKIRDEIQQTFPGN